jgi:HD-GYP domain-containing protein (c-di-GMP phosphodiesterase class II)
MQTHVEPRNNAPVFAGDSLPEEVAASLWMQQEVQAGRAVPVAEADIVLAALRAAMRRSGTLIPMAVGDGGGFHAVHAVNVAVLAMAIADDQKFDEDAVRKVGGAALLHDVGMWRLPNTLVAKQGALTDADRKLIKQHPVEGARLILAADATLDLAAVVAYEHHVRADGSGYPRFHYARATHYISRLVQVCDVFHALHSPRPFRKSWPLEFVLSFMNERAGFEFHPGLVEALSRTVERGGLPASPVTIPA